MKSDPICPVFDVRVGLLVGRTITNHHDLFQFNSKDTGNPDQIVTAPPLITWHPRPNPTANRFP
jgi:hypothetical protein